MTITPGHSHRGTGRPSENMRHNCNRRPLFQKLCGCRVPEIVETKSFQWILDVRYFSSTFQVATAFRGILSLTARRALDRSRDVPPRRAPVDNPARGIDLSVFACGKHEMFRARERITVGEEISLKWVASVPNNRWCKCDWHPKTRMTCRMFQKWISLALCARFGSGLTVPPIT